MRHFKLTDTTKRMGNITLYQIELIVDTTYGKKGDKGGWVESMDNLYDNAFVSGAAIVYGNVMVYGSAMVHGNAMVSGNARVSDNAMVSGNARVSGNSIVSGNARVSGNSIVSGGEFTTSPLQIQGSNHFINESKNGYLRIGCKELTLKEWEDNFVVIGKENGYSNKQIEEYKLYIDLAISLSKLSEK